MAIEIRNITKAFGKTVVLDNIWLRVEAGELVALLGPSGSGKTTLLRIIAGLETPDQGAVYFEQDDVSSRHPRDRRVGFVFQHYALFRHMTVYDNVAFGLQVRARRERLPASQIRERVHRLLELVQMLPYVDRFPSQLSGGQRQRVALARALAIEPRVLLLDEPFGALDAKVRQELRRWLRNLHERLHVTTVLVTHDQEEALEIADRIVIMNAGRVEQVGPPEQVYHHPANPFVCDFIGRVNVFHARVVDGRIRLGNTEIDVSSVRGKTSGDGPVTLYVRPHEVRLGAFTHHGRGIAARIRRLRHTGPFLSVELEGIGEGAGNLPPFEALVDPRQDAALAFQEGDLVLAHLGRVHVFAQS